MADPQIPSGLGGSWKVFAQEWCLGASVAEDPASVALALSGLERHWPEEVQRLSAGSSRGPQLMVPAIELGSLLVRCEKLRGFDEVLAKIRNRDRSAYSELVLVAELVGLGYHARFASPVDGKVLDASCKVRGTEVYFEVMTPEASDESQAHQDSVAALHAAVTRSVSRCRVEIELFGALDDTREAAIVRTAASVAAGAWTVVPETARLRRVDASEHLPALFDGDGASVVVGGAKDVQDESTVVIVRWEPQDMRARRLFGQEYNHFSRRVSNVLVVNTGAVPDGILEWPIEMARRLQPNMNRKVGAVAYFEQGYVGPPERISRRWRLLANPHALIPIPNELLAALESLDDSATRGLPPLTRVVAAHQADRPEE